MATQKLAYRRLVRNQPDNQLHVEFVDAQTGEVITDLAGYTLVDQGNDLPKTTTTADELPVDPHKGRTGPARKDEGHTDWGETASQDYSRGSNSGKSLIDGLTNTFNTAKKGIGAIQDAKDKGKMDIATWITQVTGGAIIPDNIKKTDVNENGVKVGTAYNVPPVDNKVTPNGDSAALDKVMGADSDTPSNSDSVTPTVPSKGGFKKAVIMEDSINQVDPTLLAIINEAALRSPYEVQLISGNEGRVVDGKTRDSMHTKGKALDVQLVNKETGEILPNYQDGKSFKAYEEFAQTAKIIQEQKYPAASNLAWGGYFWNGGPGNYGNLDVMHFSFGEPMGAGSWEGGASEAQKKAYPDLVSTPLGDPKKYTLTPPGTPPIELAGFKPITPTDASRSLSGQTPVNSTGAKANDTDSIPHPAVVAANEARKSLGLTPILDATQEALAGVSASIPRYDITMPEMAPLNKGDLDKMRMLGLDNPFGGIVRGAADGMLKDAFGGMVGAAKQIIPAVASNMAGGFVDSVNSGISTARDAIGGFLAPREQSTTVNPTPNSLQTMTGLPHIDVAKAQAEEAKQTLQQAKVQEQIDKTLALADAGFMGKAAQGKTVSEPISEAYSLKNAERRDMLIRTVLGEAEGEGTVGQLAVINTIKNRALATGTDPLDIVKAPEQYDGIKRASKFSPNDPLYKQVGVLLDEAWKGQLPDNTGGAKHFHANWDNPGWGATMVQNGTKPVKIGNQTFYPEQGKNPMGMEGLSTGFLGPQARRGPEIQTLNNGQAFIGKASTPAKSNTLSEMAGTGFMPRSSSSSRTSLSDMTGLGTKTPAKIPAGVNTSSGGNITKNQSDAIRSTGGGRTSDGPYTPSPASSGSKGVGSGLSGGVAKNPTTTVPRTTTPSIPNKNLSSGSSSVGSGTKTTTTTTKNSSGSKANSLDGN